MGRVKTSNTSGATAVSAGRESKSTGDSNILHSSGSTGAVSSDTKLKELLSELHHLIHQVQEERSRGENNLTNITKTQERIQLERIVSPYYKTKLKGLYNTAMQDAESETELLRRALDKIAEVKAIRNGNGNQRKPIVRRGVLMSQLVQNANSLPLWVGKPGERPPPLCSAMPVDSNYIASPGDMVAARVKGQEDEENWILAEVVSYNAVTAKYDVDDIDAEEGKERHTLSRRRIVPLPRWKADPETNTEALFPKGTLVLALYPQTTCFYRAVIHEPPRRIGDDYMVLFEDNSYPDGYSPPLNVAQRYVILCKEDKKK
jgi:SAGA-associated factor 29